jgi:hypothetical protein
MLPSNARAAQGFPAAGGRGSLRALPAFGALPEPAHKFCNPRQHALGACRLAGGAWAVYQRMNSQERRASNQSANERSGSA